MIPVEQIQDQGQEQPGIVEASERTEDDPEEEDESAHEPQQLFAIAGGVDPPAVGSPDDQDFQMAESE